MESNPAQSAGELPLQEGAWSRVKGLPCRLSAEVSIPHFTVRKLLDLSPGDVLDTYVGEGSHVPVLVNVEGSVGGSLTYFTKR